MPSHAREQKYERDSVDLVYQKPVVGDLTLLVFPGVALEPMIPEPGRELLFIGESGYDIVPTFDVISPSSSEAHSPF